MVLDPVKLIIGIKCHDLHLTSSPCWDDIPPPHLWLWLKAAPVFPDWQSTESFNVLERFFEVGRLALS